VTHGGKEVLRSVGPGDGEFNAAVGGAATD
jgi:hypothetical protein